MNDDPRALIFAVDGATWDVMDPLMASGKMPNMAGLVARGARGRLKTLIPTWSPRIWTSIATGALPEKHGIETFVVKVPGTDLTTLPTSNLRRKTAFWNILSSPECSVGIAGYWATYPAEAVNGFIISDHASIFKKKILRDCLDLTDENLARPNAGETYPESLRSEIEPHIRLAHEFDDSELKRFIDLNEEDRRRLESFSSADRGECLSVLKYLYINDQLYRHAALFAAKKYRPTVLTVFLAGVDGVEHHFWKYMEPEKFPHVPPDLVRRYGGAIENYYIYLDEALGGFLKDYSDEAWVMIVSDHGHEAEPTHGTKRAEGYGKIACGTHDNGPDGIFLLAGPGVRRGVEISGASVLDITPTLLALYGRPVAGDMDGKVLRDALEEDFLENRPVTFVDTYSPAGMGEDSPVSSPADEELKAKLRALGYIE